MTNWSKTCVSGVARNAKSGAVISRPDGDLFHMSELREWPEAVCNKLVTVTGLLSREVVTPEATQDDNGGWTQGRSEGSDENVLRDAVWERCLSKPKTLEREGHTSTHTMQTSKTPIKAPANYASLPVRPVSVSRWRDLDDLTTTWTSSGEPTDKCCEQCGNQIANEQIFCNQGTSYPNGNSWDHWELVCGGCKWYSYVTKFSAG
jgi:hypothetical protein